MQGEDDEDDVEEDEGGLQGQVLDDDLVDDADSD